MHNYPQLTLTEHPPMEAITKEAEGIVKAIENLKLSSSAGDNQINSKILKT